MEAEILTVASHLNLIKAPEQIEAGKRGDLYLNKKPVLIIKGASAADAVRRIYLEFSRRNDLTGQPFRLSHKERSIMHRDQWSQDSKVGAQDLRRYIEHFFTLAELTTHNNQPVLVVLKELPVMMVQTFRQGRFVDSSMLAEFKEWID